MRLVTLGTGTVSPHPERTSAAHYLEIDGQDGRDGRVRLLLDCGAGTVHRLAKFGIPWQQITHIAITHYHADHIGELPALLFAMKYGAMQPRSAPLALIGPEGFRAKLEAFAGAFGEWVTEPGWPMEIIEIEPAGSHRLVAATSHRPPAGVSEITIEAHKTPHTPESVAYRIATPAARLVYTGDTGPSDELGDWARGCDLLLAECSLPDAMAMDIHLTPSTAAALAARAEAKRLVLTHLYPPVETEDIPGIVGRAYAGPTTVAKDGDSFDIGA